MANDTDWVIVGRFGRPHGIKGFITVISFTDPRDNIMQYNDWHVRLNDKWQTLDLLNLDINHQLILTQVKGYQDREDVACLTNKDIAIKRDKLPVLAPGEFYWHELVGMQVKSTEGLLLGTVTELMSTGANDVLIVEGEKRCLIPYLPGRSIINVDNSQRVITVDWDMDF